MTKFILIWIATTSWPAQHAAGLSGQSTFDDPVACMRAGSGIEHQVRSVTGSAAHLTKFSFACYPASSQTDIVKEMEKLHQ